MSPITEGNYKRYVTDGDKGVWLLYHRWKRRCLGALFLVVHSQPTSIRGKGRTSHPTLSQACR